MIDKHDYLIPPELLENRYNVTEDGYEVTFPAGAIVTCHFSKDDELQKVTAEMPTWEHLRQRMEGAI